MGSKAHDGFVSLFRQTIVLTGRQYQTRGMIQYREDGATDVFIIFVKQLLFSLLDKACL